MLQFFLDKIYIYYLDDILVYSEDKKQYTKYIKKGLEILTKKSFCLKLSKYNFHIRIFIFLGYVITLGKIGLDPEKIRAITTWETPITIK
jgi:hypothetical protein